MDAKVSSLHIYPDSDSPGQELDEVEITSSGPEGNRSKKHAVHLVSVDAYVASYPKANVVIDVDTSTLDGMVGRVVRVGECTLTITQKPSQCAGVYAEVLEPGTVRVDDLLLLGDEG